MKELHYFKRKEFSCKCGCGGNTVDYELMFLLCELRRTFNAPVNINSGFRCKNHNKEIGGSEKSQHLTGKAADIVVDGIPPEYIYNHLDFYYPDKYGIGLYKTFVHIDVREKKARW